MVQLFAKIGIRRGALEHLGIDSGTGTYSSLVDPCDYGLKSFKFYLEVLKYPYTEMQTHRQPFFASAS